MRYKNNLSPYFNTHKNYTLPIYFLLHLVTIQDVTYMKMISGNDGVQLVDGNGNIY